MSFSAYCKAAANIAKAAGLNPAHVTDRRRQGKDVVTARSLAVFAACPASADDRQMLVSEIHRTATVKWAVLLSRSNSLAMGQPDKDQALMMAKLVFHWSRKP